MKPFAKPFRIIATLVALVFIGPVVAGCQSGGTGLFQTFSNVASVATQATVPTKQVVLARQAFNAVEVTATNFLKLPTCDGANGPICSPAAATQPTIDAVTSGRLARNNLTAFMKAHPGQLGPKGLYDALTAATTTLQSIIAKYKAG